MNIFKLFVVLLVTMAVLGCAESSRPVPTGKGNIRGLNSAVAAPDLAFLIEERVIGLTPYKESSIVRELDDLDYFVNFDHRFVGDLESTRLLSVPFTLVKDMDYLFIFTGTIAAPASLTWENPIREWDGTETVMEIEFGHLSPLLGEVDMYFAASGTVPMLGEAVATLANGNRSATIDLEAGDYEFIITAKDNPANILYTSVVITYLPQTEYLLAAFDPDPSITSNISVRAIRRGGVSVELVDASSLPTLRLFHASLDTGPVDLYRDSDFATPWIANTSYAEASAEVDTPSEEVTWTFTDAGNVGSILHEQDFAIRDGRRSTRFLIGGSLVLATVLTNDDIRPLDDSAKVRFIQTSVNQLRVDIYMVDAGTDIDEAVPRLFNLATPGNSNYINVLDKDFDVYLTVPITKDILAGPIALTTALGDVVHFAIVDNVDPNVVDLVKYEHLTAAP